jgi:hypothetical protein
MGDAVQAINVLLTVILVAVIVYILFRPGNQASEIIHALGGSSSQLTRTLTGQYAGGSY